MLATEAREILVELGCIFDVKVDFDYIDAGLSLNKYLDAQLEFEAKLSELNQEMAVDTNKYICKIFGYVYDPAAGDPDSGIAPGTAFENIPDSWICPLFAVGKDLFEVLE